MMDGWIVLPQKEALFGISEHSSEARFTNCPNKASLDHIPGSLDGRCRGGGE